MESSDDEPLVNVKKKKIKIKVKPDHTKSSGIGGGSSGEKKKRKRESDAGNHHDNGVGSKKKVKVKVEQNGNAEGPSKGSNSKSLKKLDKAERLQHAMQSFLWWNAKDPPEGYQWLTMEHAGVSFPEPYVPHGVKMLYEGKPVDLTPIQEEA